MSEKINQTENQQIKKERFEFVFTVNGNIICQRYFRINGFKNKSLGSKELTDSFNYCVGLIQRDLEKKSNAFLWHTSPQIFENKEEMLSHNYKEFFGDNTTYIILRDSDDVYFWNGSDIEPYNGYFNKSEYVGGNQSDTPCVLKLSFLDNGREVISRVWDGNVYPRFVRTNIDLSNSKNKYDNPANFAPFEAALIKIMIEGQQDLIPQIVKELCVCCSYEDECDYTTSVQYGDVDYSTNMRDSYYKYVSSIEQKLRKKTEKYMRTLY